MARKKETEVEAPEEAEAVVEEAVVEAEPEAKEEAKSTEQKYSVEALGKYALKLFGVSSWVYAGATATLTGEYTVDEMKKAIEEWQKRKV